MAVRVKDRIEANIRQSDKVNNSLSIQLNSGTATVYNGSAAKSINVTPAAIGAPSTDGTGASGTWNITSASTQRLLSSDTRSTSIIPTETLTGLVADFKAKGTVGITASGNYVGVLTWRSYSSAADLSGGQPIQIAYTQDNELQTRLGNTSSWGSWVKILNSNNYTSYTVTKTGTGATGTWGISISGNAATATKANQLATARTISLTGAITGSGSFNGTGDLNITTSVNHTHNYLPLSGGVLSGNLTIQNNSDIILKASSSNPNDPGDLVFAKGDGSEQCRIWTMAEGVCYIRFGTDKSMNTIIHTGNINNYIPVDAKFLGYFNLLPFSDINKYGTIGWETNGSTILSYRGSYNFYDTIALDGSSSTGGIKGKMWVRLKPNTVYTYSAIVHSLIAFSPTTSTPLHSWCAPTAGAVAHTDTQISVYPTTVPANTYTRLSVTFRTNSDPVTYFLPIIYSIPATTQFCIGQISLVEGTVVPEYSPICIGDAWYKGEAIYGAVWN